MRAERAGSSACTSEKTRYQRGTKSSRFPDSTASTIRSATSSGWTTALRKNRLRRTVFCGKPSVSTKPGQHRVHPDAATRQKAGERARECELRVLGRGVRPRRREGDRPCDRDDVDDVRPRLQTGLERPHHPNAAEVVRPQDRLDPVRVEREEVAAAGDAGVVDEQVDAWVTFEDRHCAPVDVGALGDVADLDPHRRARTRAARDGRACARGAPASTHAAPALARSPRRSRWRRP